jgi:ABC-type Na+ transport system ATPase subunit NatA
MAKFIELHDYADDSMFVNAKHIVLFSPHTHEEDGAICTIVCIENRKGALIVKETPAEILEKIRESESGRTADFGVSIAKEIADAVKREFNSL